MFFLVSIDEDNVQFIPTIAPETAKDLNLVCKCMYACLCGGARMYKGYMSDLDSWSWEIWQYPTTRVSQLRNRSTASWALKRSNIPLIIISLCLHYTYIIWSLIQSCSYCALEIPVLTTINLCINLFADGMCGRRILPCFHPHQQFYDRFLILIVTKLTNVNYNMIQSTFSNYLSNHWCIHHTHIQKLDNFIISSSRRN